MRNSTNWTGQRQWRSSPERRKVSITAPSMSCVENLQPQHKALISLLLLGELGAVYFPETGCIRPPLTPPTRGTHTPGLKRRQGNNSDAYSGQGRRRGGDLHYALLCQQDLAQRYSARRLIILQYKRHQKRNASIRRCKVSVRLNSDATY